MEQTGFATSVHASTCRPLLIFATLVRTNALLGNKDNLSAFPSSALQIGSWPINNSNSKYRRVTRARSTSEREPESRGVDQSISTPGDDVKMLERTGSSAELEKELQKAVRKTAATFAPRASVATKNPAVPGTALYTIFEVQGYLSMALGGALSFNLLFPSNEPDIWRLMGMWSVWMFTIPSLRARDCSSKEKDALNYLFLAIPLINVLLPLVWKSFALVWSADVLAFLAMYTWKLDWLAIKRGEDN